jgi:uncharacterized membrane protein
MRFLGHPIHPMLVHFPIAFWTVAMLAYMSAAAGVGDPAHTTARFANAAALAMAALAMLAGLVELRSIDSRSAAMNLATRHMMVMATVWICFLFALMVPVFPDLDRSTARFAATALAGAGSLLMAVGGWLGGQLVYRHGVGVRQQAGP